MQEWFLHKMRPEREMLPKEISLKEENFSLVWKLSVEFPREYLCPEKDKLVVYFGWEDEKFAVYCELLDYEGQPFSLRSEDLRDVLDLRVPHLSTLIRWNGWSKSAPPYSYFEDALKYWKYSLDYPDANLPSTRRMFEMFSPDARSVFEVFSEITNFGTSSLDSPENRKRIFSLPREGREEFQKFLEDRLPEVFETFRNDLSTIPV